MSVYLHDMNVACALGSGCDDVRAALDRKSVV